MFPLSKKEKKIILKLQEMAAAQKTISLSDVETQEMIDILDLLCERGVLMNINADDQNWYFVTGDFPAFLSWVKDQEHKEKRLSKREWRIAIVSAIVGALIGLIPSVISLVYCS